MLASSLQWTTPYALKVYMFPANIGKPLGSLMPIKKTSLGLQCLLSHVPQYFEKIQ